MIKKEILKRFATPDSFKCQEIKKPCYQCCGTGIHQPYKESCYSCEGTGIYNTVYIIHKSYSLGGYKFLIPCDRSIYKPSMGIDILGYIERKEPKYYLGHECFLWLLLLFKPISFFMIIGTQHIKGSWFTPLVFLNNLLMSVLKFLYSKGILKPEDLPF